jgi:uncharacterized membrane protein
MSGRTAFFIEVVLVFGGVLAWACWELWSVKRGQRRDREASAERERHAVGQSLADPGERVGQDPG